MELLQIKPLIWVFFIFCWFIYYGFTFLFWLLKPRRLAIEGFYALEFTPLTMIWISILLYDADAIALITFAMAGGFLAKFASLPLKAKTRISPERAIFLVIFHEIMFAIPAAWLFFSPNQALGLTAPGLVFIATTIPFALMLIFVYPWYKP